MAQNTFDLINAAKKATGEMQVALKVLVKEYTTRKGKFKESAQEKFETKDKGGINDLHSKIKDADKALKALNVQIGKKEIWNVLKEQKSLPSAKSCAKECTKAIATAKDVFNTIATATDHDAKF